MQIGGGLLVNLIGKAIIENEYMPTKHACNELVWVYAWMV